jgi:hypothetical protein
LSWVEVFVVLLVSHLTGDFVLQTQWQALHKHGGLGTTARDAESRRALRAHVAAYTLVFVPALVWIGDHIGVAKALAVAALVVVPHFVQDDGRLLSAYMVRVKKVHPRDQPVVAIALDQSLHTVALFAVALLVASWA